MVRSDAWRWGSGKCSVCGHLALDYKLSQLGKAQTVWEQQAWSATSGVIIDKQHIPTGFP